MQHVLDEGPKVEAEPELQVSRGDVSRTSKRAQLKMLAVSFAYPPMLEPRAVQVSRLLRHLKTSNVLVCADYLDGDQSKNPIADGEVESRLEKVIRVPFSVSKAGKFASAVFGKLDAPLWNKSPDPLRSWKNPVVKAVQKLLSEDGYKPDMMVTFAYPLTDALIGLELKRLYGLPWLAHFSDPWTDNPSSHLDPFSKAFHSRMERMVFESADRLVFTSQETVDLVMRKYGPKIRAKTFIVPHAFEPSLFSRNPGRSGKITVRYLGTLYGERTPKPVFAALEKIVNASPEMLADVCFELVGDTCGLNLDDLGMRNLPNGLVKVTSPVDYSRSLELMQSADGLLVVDAPAKESVFLPSKLIDYVGAGRPILGITPRGAAASLIERLGGWVADPSDIEASTKAVIEFISYLRDARTKHPEHWGNAMVRREYEANKVAETFSEVLEQLV